jgi:hypothetical protein
MNKPKNTAFTLLYEVDMTFKENPWKKRKLIAAIIKGALQKTFVEPVEITVDISEMKYIRAPISTLVDTEQTKREKNE